MSETDLEIETLRSESTSLVARVRAPALTLLHHPDVGRVGQRALLPELLRGQIAEVSRKTPRLAWPGSPTGAPLAVARVSRTPTRLSMDRAGALTIEPAEGGTRVVVDDQRLEAPTRFDAAALERGLTLELGKSVVLRLHQADPTRAEQSSLGLLGPSDALARVRSEITKVARHPVPVLVRGESGVGKELVARAIHDGSARRARPFVSVNVAAIPAAMAASALFGHVRGAFTGASGASAGYFGEAEGGTLFLDEIGEAPPEIQVALLRALESGEVQPVGAPRARRVDVRLVAATDAPLEEATREGDFRLPLLHRLGGYVIRIPPLRERPEDAAFLLVHFLRVALARADAEGCLAPRADGRSWLPAWLMRRVARHDWPGNVRELRNLAQQLAIAHADAPEIPRSPELLDRFDAPSPTPSEPADPARPRRRLVDEIPERELLAALEEARYKPAEAARLLGISRTAMYKAIRGCDKLPSSTDLSAEAIEAALASNEGDAEATALALKVSERALKLRMTELGLG